MRADLLRLHPALPSGSRLYFTQVPSQVGFLAGDGPALRIWYHDPSLSGAYFGSYAARRAGAPGPDYFFRYDGSRWVEVPEDPGAPVTVAAAPDVRRLAEAFARAGEWRRAAMQYERLAAAAPGDPRRAMDAGVARAMAGDRREAMRWLAPVATSGAVPDSLRRQALELYVEVDGGVAPPGAATGTGHAHPHGRGPGGR
jgi:hypothetical protein